MPALTAILSHSALRPPLHIALAFLPARCQIRASNTYNQRTSTSGFSIDSPGSASTHIHLTHLSYRRQSRRCYTGC
jgi:hypothetical protein